MRIPWPFRRTPSDPGTAASSAPDAASHPRSRAAWRTLPPLAETMGQPPLIAPVRPFKADLAAATPPPPILPPLTHGGGLEAPKGLVVGLARPVAPPAASASLPAPVQRSPIRPGRRQPPIEPVAVEALGEPGSAELPAPATPAAASAEPVRRLPVADAAPSRPHLDLTRAAVHAPAPAGALRAAVRSASASHALAETAVQRAPAAPSPGTTPATGARSAPPPSPTLPAVQRAPVVDSRPDAVEARLTIGRARRLGLGAPILGGRVPASGAPGMFARSAPTQPGPVAPSSVGPTPSTPGPGLPGVAVAPARPAPIAPAAAALASPARSLAPASPEKGRSVQRAPTLAAPRAALTSARPIVSQVQRALLTSDPGPSGRDHEGARPRSSGSTTVPAAGGPVTVHRGPDAAEMSTHLQARSFTHREEIYLPSSHGPLTTGPARSLLAHELTHVVQQRQLGSGLPAESSHRGQELEAEAVAAERSSTLPLAIPSPPAPKREAPATPTARPQRAPEVAATPAGAAPPETAVVQLREEVQRAPKHGARSSAPGQATKRSERELEDLARQLYARIGTRLRRELLVERERAGAGLDLS